MLDRQLAVVHVVFTGFLQSQGRDVGFIKLWRQLYHDYADKRCLVDRQSWNANLNDLAEFLWRSTSPASDIKLYGYSWGGMSAVKLAALLKTRGRKIHSMLLCDAVYRHNYRLGHWRAIVPLWKIRVPGNVRRVDWFRQNHSLIRGHDVVTGTPALTHIQHPITLDYDHGHIDDAEEVHEKAYEIAAR